MIQKPLDISKKVNTSKKVRWYHKLLDKALHSFYGSKIVSVEKLRFPGGK